MKGERLPDSVGCWEPSVLLVSGIDNELLLLTMRWNCERNIDFTIDVYCGSYVNGDTACYCLQSLQLTLSCIYDVIMMSLCRCAAWLPIIILPIYHPFYNDDNDQREHGPTLTCKWYTPPPPPPPTPSLVTQYCKRNDGLYRSRSAGCLQNRGYYLYLHRAIISVKWTQSLHC